MEIKQHQNVISIQSVLIQKSFFLPIAQYVAVFPAYGKGCPFVALSAFSSLACACIKKGYEHPVSYPYPYISNVVCSTFGFATIVIPPFPTLCGSRWSI